MHRLLPILCSALSLVFVNGANAQKYPAQPVRIVVPFAPGSATDIIAKSERAGAIAGRVLFLGEGESRQSQLCLAGERLAAPLDHGTFGTVQGARPCHQRSDRRTRARHVRQRLGVHWECAERSNPPAGRGVLRAPPRIAVDSDVQGIGSAGVRSGDLAAPAGTPRPIVDLLSREVRQIFAEPDIQKRLQQQGVVPTTTTPEETQAYVIEEIRKWGQVVQRAKVELPGQ